MARIKWNPGAVTDMAATVSSFGATVGQVRGEYAQQRARLDPEFQGDGASTYYEKQQLAEQGLKEMEAGLNQLASIVRKSLQGTIETDQMSKSFFG